MSWADKISIFMVAAIFWYYLQGYLDRILKAIYANTQRNNEIKEQQARIIQLLENMGK